MRDIPDLHRAEPIPAAARAELEELLLSGDLFRYTAPQDSPVALLEAEFAQLLGSRFALAVASCSAALFLSLKALDMREGAKVLIPAFTFAAVPSSVVHAGCTPVLCEVGSNYRIDPNHFHHLLDQGIDAVMISHMRGHTSDMDMILTACAQRNIPVIEDAAHSLGTKWHGRNIGTLGRIGCFSFQSYKMVNGGEGGILITDDADIAARAVIMSGAYEHNWKKHPILPEAFARWQNRLPLYNTRMSNLSAVVIRPQLADLARRVSRGRANHDALAATLNTQTWCDVPAPLPPEERAPDSIQFNLTSPSQQECARFIKLAEERGLKIQVFGQSTDNARAFWNWQFLENIPDLPQTRAMLMRACDLRLPIRLTETDLDTISDILLWAGSQAFSRPPATT